MIKIKTIALYVSLLLFIGCSQSTKTNACDETSSRLVARAYVMSIPYFGRENDLISLMKENPGFFDQDGKATQCMQALGTALVRRAITMSRQYQGRSATEIFGGSMPDGLASLPGQVDASMRSVDSDSFSVGQELIWLSHVLPPAAHGNYTPYNTTGTQTRQMIRQAMFGYNMLCQMSPDLCRMMLGMFQQYKPQIEQHVYVLARQVGN